MKKSKSAHFWIACAHLTEITPEKPQNTSRK